MSAPVLARVDAMWPELGIDARSPNGAGRHASKNVGTSGGRPLASESKRNDRTLSRVLVAARELLRRASE